MRGHSSVASLVLALLVQLVAGCGEKIEKPIDKGTVDASVESALYFDLNEAPDVTAALFVRSHSAKAALRSAMLPFTTSQAGAGDRTLLTTWGSHDGITLITYVSAPSMPASATISIKPVFEPAQEMDFVRTDLRGSLYFMSSGLKRRFVYQWPQTGYLSADSWNKLRTVGFEGIDFVLVRLPKDAEVFERNAASLVPLEDRQTTGGRLKTYSHSKPDSPPLNAIDISYQVPPTKVQTQIYEYVLKAFGTLIVPLVSLLLLTSNKVKAKKTRMAILVAGGGLEAIILIGLLWWAFKVQSVAGMGALLDLGLVILSAALTLALAFVKGED